jgi:ElaB/YqjD/DUF883 family membrane-anchored ribosome-binding protein
VDDLESITSQLEEIAERLNDVAMSIISEAIENGETVRPPLEKQVSQARRAVEKAIQHLQRNQ